MGISRSLKDAGLCTAIITAVLLSIITSLSSVAETWFMGNVLDNLLYAQTGAFWFAAIMMVASVLVQYLSSTADVYLSDWTLQRFSRFLRLKLLQKTADISYEELENIKTGDYLSYSLSDIDAVKQFISDTIGKSGGIIASVTALLVCININWIFTILCIIAIILILVLGILISLPVQKASLASKAERGKANSCFINLAQNLVTVKSYRLETAMGKLFGEALENLRSAAYWENKLIGISAGYGKLSGGLMYLAMFAGGAYFIFKGELSLGRFFAFAYIFSNIQSIQNIQELMTSYQRSKAALNRIQSFLDKQEETDAVISRKAVDPDGIAVTDLTFRYQSGQPVLHHLSFQIKKGTCTAIVGKSGCGKSTLVKLLTALYQPESGTILLEGAVKASDIRAKINVVSQQDMIFPTTIRENLQIVRPDATEESMIKACQNAEIYDFIQTLPDGLDTQVGELGGRLSGGQRQRICIARAFLKDAPVLILDEPTAALDIITESKLLESLEVLMKGRTTVLISHRLSAIRKADKVLFMENGSIIQRGTPDELLKMNGEFSRLFSKELERA